jgi:hypothetical protein
MESERTELEEEEERLEGIETVMKREEKESR